MYGVLTQEKMFATNIVYPLVEEGASYNLFKKAYLLYSLGIISRVEFWVSCGIEESKISEYEEKVVDSVEVNPAAQEVISELSKRGWTLLLASEGPRDWTEKILTKHRLIQYFDSLYVSSDVGHTKPYRQFFEKLPWKNKNISRNIYIDDTFENLVAAEKLAPVTGVWFVDESHARHANEITNLNELLAKKYDQ